MGMSGMADEMAARMSESGQVVEPVPGNGVDQGTEQTPPAAGQSNTDTGAGGTPETIPYARFKEVNDRLAGFRELEQFGYDADSLRRLAGFEQQYLQDPVGTWAGLMDNLDLPQELKDQITQHIASGSEEPGSAGGNGSETQKPAELSPEDRQRLEFVDRIVAERQEAEQMAQLDRVLSAWNDLDKQDNFTVDDQYQNDYERMKLQAISATASAGNFTTIEELAKAAREGVMGFRSAILGEAIQRTGRQGSPAPLLGSGSAPAPPVKFKDMREATRAAEADLKAGRIPN